MNGIVKRLEDWVRQHSHALEREGVFVGAHLPLPGSNLAWKAVVELMHGDIIVHYSVWEREVLETSLIVMNTNRNSQTIIMDDKIVDSADVVDVDLGDVMRKLLDGTFANMEPDPKLVVNRSGERKQ